MQGMLQRLWKRSDGAVAPTVALSLFGLIAAGGLAFDYARLAAMDTELQQAADQAALAAATQLDRSAGSTARATAAIQGADANRLARNLTRFSNDDAGTAVEITSITFCSEFDDTDATMADACTETSVDAQARFVMVTTELRTANYAFTPIVQAVSGTSYASAVAGVESAICNVAPLMVCAPTPDWPTSADIGKGLRLKPFDTHEPWAPGNYGLLDFGNGVPAVLNALHGFGLNGCMSQQDTQTEPGVKEVTDAINTRLDVYDGGQSKADATCVPATGYGCPAKNNQKDMVRTETYTVDTDQSVTTPPAAPACGANADDWPDGVIEVGAEFALNSTAKSFERDSCHYTDEGCTGGNIGNGTWDYAGYMAANHPGSTYAGPATRYGVYLWELENDLNERAVSSTHSFEDKKIRGVNRRVWTFTKQCAYRNPIHGDTSYPDQKDRRLLPILAADCTNLQGRGTFWEDFVLLRAFDVFITEPSMDRVSPTPTDNKEIYGEIVGPAVPFESSSGFQYYARARPYLVR